MKRTMLLIASMMLALLVAAGVALAQEGVTKICKTNCHGTERDDQLIGTAKRNSIEGRNGADRIEGNGAKDTLNGNLGADAVYGGNGEDKVYGGDNDDYVQAGIKNDRIYTGSGNDVVAAYRSAFSHTGATRRCGLRRPDRSCCRSISGP